MKQPTLAMLGIALALTSCSASQAMPTEQDIEAMFGFEIHDTSCVAASGKPGFMCTFITDGQNWAITRRIIKTEDGWHDVDGN